MKVQLLVGVGIASLLAACSPSSSGSGASSGTGAAATSINASLTQDEVSSIAALSANNYQAGMKILNSGGDPNSFGYEVQNLIGNVGHFPSLSPEANPNCETVAFEGGALSIDFSCDAIKGSISTSLIAPSSGDSSLTISHSVDVQVYGSADTATLKNVFVFGPIQISGTTPPTIIPGQISRNDSFTMGGIQYSLVEESNLTFSPMQNIVNFTGSVDIKKNGVEAETFSIASSSTLSFSSCGLKQGSITLQGSSDVIVLQYGSDCTLSMTVNSQPVLLSPVVTPPIVTLPLPNPIPLPDPTQLPVPTQLTPVSSQSIPTAN